MSDETTLLPCPWCGCEMRVEVYTYLGLWFRVVPAENHGEACFLRGVQHRRFSSEESAIAAWNTRAEHGTLTAEQVREAIEKRFDFDVWVPADRWQAIANELNAELRKAVER